MTGPAPTRAVITDMDGTLYSWVDYMVPALEAMVTSLRATTGLDRPTIVAALREVYERHETNEYAFVIQESSIYVSERESFEAFDARVITPAREAFAACRRRYLRPYPEVVSTLEALRDRGLRVIALTDAPRAPAERRLKQLGLDRQIDALYALESYPLPRRVDQVVRAREQAGLYRSSLGLVVELPPSFEKPAPLGIERILADFGLTPEEGVMIGDNLKKDVAAAAAAGVRSVWAEYGTYVSPEYRERLSSFSARALTEKNLSTPADHQTYRPGATVSNFRQILDLL